MKRRRWIIHSEIGPEDLYYPAAYTYWIENYVKDYANLRGVVLYYIFFPSKTIPQSPLLNHSQSAVYHDKRATCKSLRARASIYGPTGSMSLQDWNFKQIFLWSFSPSGPSLVYCFAAEQYSLRWVDASVCKVCTVFITIYIAHESITVPCRKSRHWEHSVQCLKFAFSYECS